MFFKALYVSCATGTLAGTTPDTEPMIYLDFSDDKGFSFSNPIAAGLGAAGEYNTQPQFLRLGNSRSRVFRLSWSAPTDVALLGAWVDVEPGAN